MAPSAETIQRDDGSWITDEFLKEILGRAESTENILILNKDITFAVPIGDNYLSIVFRVKVDYKQENSCIVEEHHFIVKGFPNGEVLQKFIVDKGLFDRELNMYHIALPKIKTFAENRLKNSSVPAICAKVYTTSRPNTVVLEDMKYEGFQMANRKNLLDLKHCELVAQNIAKLHAMSAAFHQHYPDLLPRYDDTFYGESNIEDLELRIPTRLKGILKHVKTWPGYETFAENLENFIPVCIKRLVERVKPLQNGFNVLGHGDCWVNNYLFKYSEKGEPIDIRFVDFQLSRFGSPALDLSYFMYTSLNAEVRAKHTDHLLKVYHDQLSETLTDLGCDAGIFTFQDLKTEMKRLAVYAFIAACNVMPVVIANKEDVPDLASFNEEEMNDLDFMEKVLSSSRFRDIFQQLIPFFEDLEVFN